MRNDEIGGDLVLDELKQPKAERERDKQKLAQLEQRNGNGMDTISTQEQLDDFCARIQQNLNGCGFQEKRMALDALDVRVVATPEKVDIRLAVPLACITTERT